MKRSTLNTEAVTRLFFTLTPLPRGACPSCGVDHQTDGKLCAKCEEVRNQYPHTQFMKERGK